MVISCEGNMHVWKLMDLTGFKGLIGSEMGTLLCKRDDMHLWHCGFLEANLISLLSDCDVPCRIHNIVLTTSSNSNSYPNVVHAESAAN
jgi:hypothetical protein